MFKAMFIVHAKDQEEALRKAKETLDKIAEGTAGGISEMDEAKIKRLIDAGAFQGKFLYFIPNLDGDFLFSFEHPDHSYGVYIPLYSLEALVSDLEFFCQGKSKYPKKGQYEIFRGDVLNIEKIESHLYLRIWSELIFFIMIPSQKLKGLSRDFSNLLKHVKTKIFPIIEEEVQTLN